MLIVIILIGSGRRRRGSRGGLIEDNYHFSGSVRPGRMTLIHDVNLFLRECYSPKSVVLRFLWLSGIFPKK